MQHRFFALTLLCICIAIFLYVPHAQATTYYVDSIGGNDGSNGTSSSSPWQTIAKINSSIFHPGDSILFKSGDAWREQLNITHSGSAGNPITFGSYGVGAMPIISGANLATGWTSTAIVQHASSTNVTIWTVDHTTSTNQVFEDGTRLVSSVASSAMSPGSFYYDAGEGKVYVRTFSDDNPNSHAMEISSRNYAIYEAGGAEHITLQNLQTSSANATDIYFNGSASVIISNISAIKSFGEGIRFDVVSDSTIVSSTVAWNGSSGISADDAPSLVINGCIAHDNASLANVNYTAGIKISPDYAPYPSSTNVTIENCESYANGIGQPDWRGAGIWADTVGNNLLVQYNLVYGNNTQGIYFDADNHATAAYNVVRGNGQISAVDGAGIAVYGDGRITTGNSVYGNTVYGNRTAGITVQGATLASGCESNTVENNISVNTVSGPNFSATGGCENSGTNGSGNVYAYNGFGAETKNLIEWGSGNFLSTYVAFDSAYGSATHSLKSDPAFTNAAAGDFTLTPSSPAIDAGLNLGSSYENALLPSSSWPGFVATGNQNTYGTRWEIGAFVFVGSRPEPPTNLTTKIQ